MMVRKLHSIAFFLITLSVLGQETELKVKLDNPLPRKSDDFMVSFRLTEAGTMDMWGGGGEDIEHGKGTFQPNFDRSGPGKKVIPSMTIALEGQEFTSREIEFEMIEDLPYVDSGIWINAAKVVKGGSLHKYIVLEQILAETPQDWLDLDVSGFEDMDINIYPREPYMEQKTLIKNPEDPFSAAMTVMYYRKIYVINVYENLTKPFDFNPSMLLNVPSGIKPDISPRFREVLFDWSK